MGIIQSSFNQVASEAVKVGGVIKPLLEQTKLTPELLNKYADKLLAEQRNLNTSIQGIAKANELSTHLDEANDKSLSDNRDKPIDKKDVVETYKMIPSFEKNNKGERVLKPVEDVRKEIEESFAKKGLNPYRTGTADYIKQQEAIDNLNQLSLAKERQKIMKSIMRDSYKGGIK